MSTGAFVANPGAGGDTFSADLVATEKVPYSKIDLGIAGASSPVTSLIGMPAAAQRRDSDALAGTDGQWQPLYTNEYGRLKVSSLPGYTAPSTGSITANAQTVFVNVARTSNLSISMVATTLVGHNVTFEASNNSTTGTDGNWYTVQVVRSNANTVEAASGVLAATPAYMWQVNVSDYGWFRVRATAHTSGTAAYILAPSAFASEPIPATQITGTQPISGTVGLSAGTNTIGYTRETPLAKVDRSITLTLASQQAAAANAARGVLIFQNQDTANAVHVNIGAAATLLQGSIRIAPGGYLELRATTGTVNVIAASITPAPPIFTIWEF